MSIYKFDRSFRNFIATAHDIIMAALSFLLAVYIRLGDELIADSFPYLFTGMIIFTAVSAIVFLYMRLYRGSWRYASMRDLSTIVKAVTLSILIFALLMFVFNRLSGLPRSVLFINWMVLLMLLGGPRFIYRALKDHTLNWNFTLKEVNKIPVLLIGAGDAAEQFIRNSQRNFDSPYEVVGLVDDDPTQKGRTIHRVNIYGDTQIIPTIIKKLSRKGRSRKKLLLAMKIFPAPVCVT